MRHQKVGTLWLFREDRRTLAVFAFMILFLLCSPCSMWPQRLCCEGGTLDQVDPRTSRGLRKGIHSGPCRRVFGSCYRLVKILALPVVLSDENNPMIRCLKQMPDFSKGPEYFARQVTQLYTTHPEDRILLTTEILEALESGKSVQDIHEHSPFPTQIASPTGGSQR